MSSTKHVEGFRESDLTSVKRVGGLQKFGQSVLNTVDRIFGESVMTSEKRIGYGRFVEDRSVRFDYCEECRRLLDVQIVLTTENCVGGFQKFQEPVLTAANRVGLAEAVLTSANHVEVQGVRFDFRKACRWLVGVWRVHRVHE